MCVQVRMYQNMYLCTHSYNTQMHNDIHGHMYTLCLDTLTCVCIQLLMQVRMCACTYVHVHVPTYSQAHPQNTHMYICIHPNQPTYSAQMSYSTSSVEHSETHYSNKLRMYVCMYIRTYINTVCTYIRTYVCRRMYVNA